MFYLIWVTSIGGRPKRVIY